MFHLTISSSKRSRKSRSPFYTGVRRRQYRTDARRVSIHKELSEILKQLRHFNHHHSMSVFPLSSMILSESSSPRYLSKPLHDPIRLHRGGCRRRWCPNILHPHDHGRWTVTTEQGPQAHLALRHTPSYPTASIPPSPFAGSELINLLDHMCPQK